MPYDLLLKGGTVIDGTGQERQDRLLLQGRGPGLPVYLHPLPDGIQERREHGRRPQPAGFVGHEAHRSAGDARALPADRDRDTRIPDL